MFKIKTVGEMFEDPADELEYRGTRRSGNRADRRKATRRAKRRMQEKAEYSFDFIDKHGNVHDTGFREYSKGAKAYTRKNRRAGKNLRPEEEVVMPEPDDYVEEIILFYNEEPEDPWAGLNLSEIENMIADYAAKFLRQTGQVEDFIQFVMREKRG